MKIPTFTKKSALLAALLAVCASPAFAASNYRVEVLPDHPSTVSGGPLTVINDNSIVIGTASSDGEFNDTSPVWDAAGNVSLIANSLFVFDVNSSNQFLSHDSIWSNGTFTPVAVPLLSVVLQAINDAGQVTGYGVRSDISAGLGARAFLWTNGVATEFPTLPNGGNAVGTALNIHGVVVGNAMNSSLQQRAVMWKNGVITDLGTLPGYTSSIASDVNDLGQITGYASASGKLQRGFIWQNGVMTELPGFAADLRVYPGDINNAGQITGYGATPTGRTIAFLWSNGVMRDLNPVMGGDAGYGCSALDINNAGQIIGGCGPNVRLTPSAPATDVGIELIPSSFSATQGSPLNYTIKVSNVGALIASGVTVTDLLPAGVSMVSAVPSQGSCTGTSSVVCALGTLNVDGVATIALVVTPANTGSLSNSVSVATNEVDAHALNNTASATVTVNALVVPADLSVTISGPGTATTKQNITYTMTVKNSGPAAAKTVTLRNLLAANLYFVSSSTTLGTCSGASCSLGTMAAGTTATVKLVVRPLSRGTYTSTSSVTFGGTDNNTANNAATITTVVK